MRAAAPIGCRRCGSPVGTGLPLIVGAGFIPPAGVCPAAGVRDDASIVPYRGLRHDKVAVSRLGTGLPLIVGAGFIPPAGVCAAVGSGGMRASRPTVAWVVAAVQFGGAFRKVCRGGPWPSRGTLRRREVPGTMRASSPTEVCCNGGPRFPGWPRHSPSSVGADSISARRDLRRRGVRRDEGIPPYGRLGGCGRPVWPVVFRGL